MKKITTLFKKNPENLGRVINEVNPGNEWVFNGEGKATRKFDGTAAMVQDGVLYKRYDVKKGREVPEGAFPCQEPDEITGHWPHWVACKRDNKEDKYFWEAFDREISFENRTYELCGPKINGNKEDFPFHVLIPHGADNVELPKPITYNTLQSILMALDIEGFVFHHPDGRMCKIRKSDYGIKRTNA